MRRKRVRVSHHFRMYPAKGESWYFRVLIFPTLREMNRYVRARLPKGKKPTEQVAGCCLNEIPDSRHVSTICFAKRWMTADTVAHEMAHATFQLAERKRFVRMGRLHRAEHEEWFATVLGRLNGGFYTRAIKLGAFP